MFNKIPLVRYYRVGRRLLNNTEYREGIRLSAAQESSLTKRTDVINYLLSCMEGRTTYLEIGVRNPKANYNHVIADTKYSVDPGIEYHENPVDFRMTSDEFFSQLTNNRILSNDFRFDVIFIDGAHRADQVDRDITHALAFTRPEGFVVLHDCNPPTEWHTRVNYEYRHSPAQGYWNGTTWKAFVKRRADASINSCCIDVDWGIGILSQMRPIGKSEVITNPFYEFDQFSDNRQRQLGLITFEDFKSRLEKSTLAPASRE